MLASWWYSCSDSTFSMLPWWQLNLHYSWQLRHLAESGLRIRMCWWAWPGTRLKKRQPCVWDHHLVVTRKFWQAPASRCRPLFASLQLLFKLLLTYATQASVIESLNRCRRPAFGEWLELNPRHNRLDSAFGQRKDALCALVSCHHDGPQMYPSHALQGLIVQVVSFLVRKHYMWTWYMNEIRQS